MAITLLEIRTATMEYLKNYTILAISNVTTRGNQLDPDEEFTFTISPVNSGGIRLKNVRLKVWVSNDRVAKLKVAGDFLYNSGPITNQRPPENIKDLNGNSVQRGGLLNGMEITLYNDWKELNPGEVVLPLTFTGKATSQANGGKCGIYAQLIADIDEDYLFPKNRVSNEYSNSFAVVG